MYILSVFKWKYGTANYQAFDSNASGLGIRVPILSMVIKQNLDYLCFQPQINLKTHNISFFF